ncbi:tol-pal system protein YbgF [Aerophototrophica crusticola]|uniref:Cell division coordinator CpoB n=1 Tax=Aerophototrophica crusticola TaxID=1709002 RepID=A0A858R8V4_9PROT|nr:tol-pal system protein YbgF [Rhodospirillaceae bacterium B3]
MTLRPAAFRRPLMAAAVALLAALPLAGGAWAQSADMRDLFNRLDRLENEMQTLNREVYRGGGRSGGSSAPAGVASANPGVVAGLEARMTTLENNMQVLTGRYEEASFQLGQIREQLTKMQQDMDLRLSRLEQGQGGGLGGPPPSSAAADAAGQSREQLAAAGTTAPKPTLPTETIPDASAGTLPGGTEAEQYDYAFNLIRQGDYANAEKAFAQFVKLHPNHSLSGNAQYWLGETLYVRNKFKEAAIAFAEGFQKYPKSNKAPDNLLKLAMALGNLNRREDACAALDELNRGYKEAPATIKRRSEQERARLKCK